MTIKINLRNCEKIASGRDVRVTEQMFMSHTKTWQDTGSFVVKAGDPFETHIYTAKRLVIEEL